MRQFQEYVEPDEANEDRRRSGIKDEDRVLLPLDENILSDNLGLPMVVVVTKVSQCFFGARMCTLSKFMASVCYKTKNVLPMRPQTFSLLTRSLYRCTNSCFRVCCLVDQKNGH